MAGTCIFKAPHSCGSKDGLQVFENEDGTVTGWCFSCSTYESNPLGDHTLETFPAKKRLKKTKEQIEAEIEEIKSYPVENYKESKLVKQALDDFGIRMGFDEETGTELKFLYFPYRKEGKLKAYKVKLLDPKRFWSVGDQKDVDLFGWDEAVASGSKRLIICEGELDCPAVLQAYKKNARSEYRGQPPGIVSLPHGAGHAGESLAKNADKIRRHFKEVILLFDNDAAGEQAVAQAVKALPEAKVATVPFGKDARDCIVAGKSKALYNAFSFNAQKRKNTRLIWGETLHESARKPAEWGIDWPWQHLTDVTRGIRKGETIYIGAGVKMGKSEIVNALGAHFIQKGMKVFMAKPEEANQKTYKLVAGKLTGRVFHDPKVEFDEQAYDEAGEMMRGKLAMIDLYQNITWETLSGDIRAAAHEGCEVFMIDPITNLTNGMNSADANVKLQEIAQELSAMAKDLNIIIFIFCHLKAPEGTPHERGGQVFSTQFAGSRAMMRSCNLMLGIEGNKDSNLEEEERNIRTLVLLEDREFGQSGRFPLYWSSKTQLFTEVPLS